MRVLFLAPSEVSSGEAITARHMAADVVAGGGEVMVLASGFAAGFLGDAAPGRLTILGDDPATNRASWDDATRGFAPTAVVFADYPLLFFPTGTVPLADEAWVRGLNDLDAALVTLDHLGYAQRPMTIDFGPGHLSLASARTPPLPARMAIALPCPVQDPGEIPARAGRPFRYWSLPSPWTPDEAARVRGMYLDDDRDVLVVHSAAGWARQAADLWSLPYYRHLSRLLSVYLTGLDRPVTVVSVNDGRLLAPADAPDVRIVNLAPIPAPAFEALLIASDLVLTENSVSVSLGKAVCGLRPAAVLANGQRLVDLVATAEPAIREIVLGMERDRLGAVFPYEVFPIWGRRELDQLGIHHANRFATGFVRLEAFGGEATRSAIRNLLCDNATRSRLRARQRAYAAAVAALPGPAELLVELAATGVAR